MMPGAAGVTLVLEAPRLVLTIGRHWSVICPETELRTFRQKWLTRENVNVATTWKPVTQFDSPSVSDLMAGIGILAKPVSQFPCLRNLGLILMAQLGNLLHDNIQRIITRKPQDPCSLYLISLLL